MRTSAGQAAGRPLIAVALLALLAFLGVTALTTGTVLLATATPFALSELGDRVLELLLAARRLAGAIGSAVAGRMVAAAAREAYGRREHRKEPDSARSCQFPRPPQA